MFLTFALAPLVLGSWYATSLLLGGAYQPGPAVAALSGPLGPAIVPVALVVALALAAGEEVG